VHLIVLPAETLHYPDAAPLRIREQSQRTPVLGEEILRDKSEQRLREHDVAILVQIVRVAVRVLDPGIFINDAQFELDFEGYFSVSASILFCSSCSLVSCEESMAGLFGIWLPFGWCMPSRCFVYPTEFSGWVGMPEMVVGARPRQCDSNGLVIVTM
jgi:hypothetical protein